MTVILKDCIKMDNGLFLCWDSKDNCGYAIDPKKVKATDKNVPAKEWIKLIEALKSSKANK